MKGFTILGVVVIHALSALLPQYAYDTSILGVVYRGLQQSLRFAVPVFIGLSGYLLVGSYERSGHRIGEFFKRRVVSLVPLYLLWTLGFVVFFHFLPGWESYYADKPWWLVWLLGYADYHMYFIPMIMLLYAMFPLLYYLLTSYFSTAFWILFIIQLGFYIYISSHTTTPLLYLDQFYYRIPLSWIWYFGFGIVAGLRPFNRVSAKIALLFVAFGWLLTVGEGEFSIRSGSDLIQAALTTRITVMMYSTALLTLIFSRMKAHWSDLLALAGKHSFVIFLSHTMFIWLIQLGIRQGVWPLTWAVPLVLIWLSAIVQRQQVKLRG